MRRPPQAGPVSDGGMIFAPKARRIGAGLSARSRAERHGIFDRHFEFSVFFSC
jgi:hypothetical protein